MVVLYMYMCWQEVALVKVWSTENATLQCRIVNHGSFVSYMYVYMYMYTCTDGNT